MNTRKSTIDNSKKDSNMLYVEISDWIFKL